MPDDLERRAHKVGEPRLRAHRLGIGLFRADGCGLWDRLCVDVDGEGQEERSREGQHQRSVAFRGIEASCEHGAFLSKVMQQKWPFGSSHAL